MAGVVMIDPGRVAGHAGRVKQVADTADQAASAASGMDLGGGAFGVLCSFMVMPLSLLSAPAQAMLNAAASTVRGAGEGIGAAGALFETTDHDLATVFDQVRQELGSS